jgi:hypothetical protein
MASSSQKLVVLAVVALALLVGSAHGASTAPAAKRIAVDSAAVAANAAAAAAPNAADKCEPLPQDVCGSTPGCVWCRCAAVPSSCFPEDQAKHLPPAVFQVRVDSSFARSLLFVVVPPSFWYAPSSNLDTAALSFFPHN